jgi:hypothetical protein
MRDFIGEFAQLLSEAADLSRQAAEVAAGGDLGGALQLESQAETLRRRARVRARNAAAAAAVGTQGFQRETGREVTIAALNELNVPVSPRAIAEYALARFEKRIDYRALASLRRDEMRAWSSPRTHRPVYVVPALEGRRFLAIRGKLTLSEWQLDRRLVGPWSERVDALRATLNIVAHYAWVVKQHPSRGAPLETVLRAYGATVPGAIESEEFDVGKLRHATQAELDVLGPEDAAWRAEAAARAEQLSEQERLWGCEPPAAVRRR